MAIGQFNTGFQAWRPSNTGFNAGFSTGTITPRVNKDEEDTYTFNSRYPGFDEEDYRKLEKMVADKGITGSKKTDIMDQLYQKLYPTVMNKHKLNERQVEINQATYKNGGEILNGNKEVKMGEGFTTLAQEAKKKYNIPYNVDDQKLVDDIVNGTENGNRLLYEYVTNGNPEIFYAAKIWDRPQQEVTTQGGRYGLINPDNEGKILPEGSERINPIGATTETIDNAAAQFADKWLDWGNTLNEIGTESLKEKLDNMSQKEIEGYRKQYKEMLKNKDWKTAQVEGDTIVEQLWNAAKGDLNYDYNDEDFGKWLIQQKANLGEYMVGADDVLQGETNPNVIQFFGNIPSSALKTFTATVRGMTNPYDTMKGLYTLAATKEGHQAFLDRYGSWDNFAKSLNTDPVGVADDMLAVAEIVGKPIGGLMKKSGNANVTKWGDRLSSMGSANDALANKAIGKIYGGLDKLADLSNNSTIQKANKILQTESSLQKMTDAGKQATKEVTDSIKNSAVGQAVKNYANEVVDKLVGVNEEDRKFIRENKDLVNQYIDGKKSVEDVFDQVKTKINDKRLANAEMGKEYETLRKNKAKVVNTEGVTADMKKKLNKLGITIDKDGNLNFSKKINKFNAPQKRALQDAWEVLKDIEGKKKINASNVLDTRQKMDDKLNWDGKASDLKDITAVDKSTEKLIKEMRGVIDERAKTSVKGLKELDKKFGDATIEMQQIKKDWLNPDGTLKDTARSKIRNLTKAGNEERLARLEKLIPGISQDLKALDVGLTIDRATKQGVGQYAKQILTAGATASYFNPSIGIPALVAGILSNPKNYVKLMEYAPDVVEKISSSISKGTNVMQDLLPSDINRIQSLAARLEDGFEE